MKYNTLFYLFAILFALISCSSEEERRHEKLQADLRTYFGINYIDSTSVVDSFQLLKLDTVSQRMVYFEQSSVLSEQLNVLINLYKLTSESMSLRVDKIRIYASMNSDELVEIAQKEFEKEKSKSGAIKAEIDTVLKVVELLDSLIVSADSVIPVGFQANCSYQIRLKDKSIQRDTAFIILNLNKDIINRKDLISLPYFVDFDKFDL